MITLRLWSVFGTLVLVSSSANSRTVEHLSEIDQDLASILNEADGEDPAAAKRHEIDTSVLSGFVGGAPGEQSEKDSNLPETDKMLHADDLNSKVNKLLDALSKDEDTHRDVAERFGSRTVKPQDSNDETENIPKELLDDLKSGHASDNADDDVVPKAFLDAEDDTDEKLAKALLDAHMAEDHATENANDDEVPKEFLDAHDETDEKLSEALLNEDMTHEAKENDDQIPQELLEGLKSEKKSIDRHPDCGAACRREVLRGILMDELKSRISAIAKRGEKIPRRMFDLWKKYRTKRAEDNLMM